MKKEIIFLQGGLGNQLFQYAFYLAKKKKGANIIYDTSLYLARSRHNGFELERIFNIKANGRKKNLLFIVILYKMKGLTKFFLLKKALLILNYFHISFIEDNIPSNYDPSLLDPQKGSGIYLYLGYWQTEKYFKEIRNDIQQAFTFNDGILSRNSLHMLHQIRQTNSISIHIRRGDFLSSQNISLYGGICTAKYYSEAISLILKNEEDTTFFAFSDDINWVKENINIPNVIFIDFNKGKDSWQDMFLMSNCKHNIIANSSFSWWGAWLNNNPQKRVISPSRFLNIGTFSEIIPSDWITL